MNDPESTYQRLGKRTLSVFLLRSSWVVFVVIIVVGGLGLLLASVSSEYSQTAVIVFWLGGLLGLISIVGSISAAWLRYSHYGVALDTTNFRFKQGIVSEEEIGIPYRRVKEVKVHRSPFEIMMGVSTLVITTAQDEQEGDQSQLRISALDKNLAAQLQDELLKRADVERVQVDPQKAGALH